MELIVNFLSFQVLSNMVKNGKANLLTPHRNIRVVNREGVEIVKLRENITKPKPKPGAETFNVEDVDAFQFNLSLRIPPLPPQPVEQPLEEINELKELKKHTKKHAGKPHKVHRYPKKFRQGKNPFVQVELLSTEEIQNFTATSEEKFWELVEILAETDLPNHVDLPLASAVLLYR